MAWTMRLVSIGAGGAEHSTDVLRIGRPDDLTNLASLGLTLGESKQFLAGLQRVKLKLPRFRGRVQGLSGCVSVGLSFS